MLKKSGKKSILKINKFIEDFTEDLCSKLIVLNAKLVKNLSLKNLQAKNPVRTQAGTQCWVSREKRSRG